MKNKRILVYGANGYTGKIFVHHLKKNGVKPILAARSNKILKLGEALDLETRVFKVADAAKYIEDIDILVNLAGPFSQTQNGLINGCINTKTHYIDIAGEYAEMQNAFKYDEEAKKSQVVVMPAGGFGVVPTDIAAKMACDKIENPKYLLIAYATVGGASRGTLKTVLKDIHKDGHILHEGQYEKAQPAQSKLTFSVLEKQFDAVYNPWRADLFTARLSTGVQNIETYSEFPGFVVSMMKGKLMWLRKLLLKWLINILPEGPTEKQLKKGKTFIKAIAKNESNETATVEIKGPEAYLFTIACLEQMITMVLDNKKNTDY